MNKKASVIIAIVASCIMISLIVSFVWYVKQHNLKCAQINAQRAADVDELDDYLEKLGDDNNAALSLEDSVNVCLRTPNIDDSVLKEVLNKLSSISYACTGLESNPGVQICINGTSITMKGIKCMAANDTIPFTDIEIGPEVCFSKTSLETYYQLLGKERMFRIIIHGDFDQSEIKAIGRQYASIKTEFEKKHPKDVWTLISVKIIIGDKIIEIREHPETVQTIIQIL